MKINKQTNNSRYNANMFSSFIKFSRGYITRTNKLEEQILQEQEKQKICWDELYETLETYENIK